MEGIWTPDLGIGVEGLDVDVNCGAWGEDERFVAEGEALGMETGCLWDEDYGAVETESLVLLLYVSENKALEIGRWKGNCGIPLRQDIVSIWGSIHRTSSLP